MTTKPVLSLPKVSSPTIENSAYELFAAEVGVDFLAESAAAFNQDDMGRISRDLSKVVIADQKKHGSKICSAKQIRRLDQTRRRLALYDSTLCYTISFDHKGRIAMTDILKVIEHRTKKGKVYECLDHRTHTHFFFTSHYFDRAKERLFKNEETRADIIDRVFMDMFREGYLIHQCERGDLQIFTNWGLSLGHGASFCDGPDQQIFRHTFEPSRADAVNAVFFKTFVDNSLLDRSQIQNLERAKRIAGVSLSGTGNLDKASMGKFIQKRAEEMRAERAA